MDRDALVEFTPEGFQKMAQLLDFLPEEQRAMMLTMLVFNISLN